MILIADGGSTKTDWRLSDGIRIHSFISKGINPYFNTREQITRELNDSGMGDYKQMVSAIYFYGAGLAGDVVKDELKNCFHLFFNTKEIFIHDDMLAAARALFGDGSGIAGILGTGSNSCLYINGVIHDKVPALGYILGDEGSGAYLGKTFLNALHKRQFSNVLCNEIILNEGLTQDVILEKVYRQEQANRYLASLTQIMIQYIQHEAVKKLVVNAFENFIDINISKYIGYKDYEISFVGSIAFHFRHLLREVMESKNLITGKIIKAPINELLNYHLTKNNSN